MSEPRAKNAFPQPPPEYATCTDAVVDSMQPPRPPAGPIAVFGDLQGGEAAVPSLADNNVPILYNESEPPLSELKKINHRILFSFQKLVGIIAEGNESPDKCMEDIKHLFLNAHYLLHKLRDVQGYENMRHCLRQKKEKLKKFKEEFDEHLREIASLKLP